MNCSLGFISKLYPVRCLRFIATRDEYTARKEQYVLEKTALTSQIAEYEAGEASRFKPALDFISASNEAGSTAWTENLEDLKDFHKSIGSNLRLVSPLSSISSRGMVADGQRKTSRGQMSPLVDSGGLSSKKDSSSAFIPMFPDLEISTAFGLNGFSSLGSKTDPALQIQYPMPWKILAHREVQVKNAGISRNLVNWRRGWDSLRLVKLAQCKLTILIFDQRSESSTSP